MPNNPIISHSFELQTINDARLIDSATGQLRFSTSFLSGHIVLLIRYPPIETKMIPEMLGNIDKLKRTAIELDRIIRPNPNAIMKATKRRK
mmetsp:Transcript_31773/g.63316  ORF Transcript_31773/g.63316 Transcript_31773/m.63316 type:complete len:91 (-) Transcript_31773:299-571(-)